MLLLLLVGFKEFGVHLLSFLQAPKWKRKLVCLGLAFPEHPQKCFWVRIEAQNFCVPSEQYFSGRAVPPGMQRMLRDLDAWCLLELEEGSGHSDILALEVLQPNPCLGGLV